MRYDQALVVEDEWKILKGGHQVREFMVLGLNRGDLGLLIMGEY